MVHPINFCLACLLCFAVAIPNAMAEEPINCEILLKQKDDTLAKLTLENAALQEKMRLIECTPSITSEALSQKNLHRLQEIGRNVKIQRQTMADFEGYVKWMSGNIAGYSKYIEAGSVAAGFAKILPIPYAGQASLFAKFVTQATLSLNSSSVAIAKYLVTSQQFISRVESIDPVKGIKTAEITELEKFADSELLKDMVDAQTKLASTAEISTSTLSFLESLNSYMGSTDEYWNKTKSLLKRSEVDKKEKSFLSESILNLKNRAGGFNARLKLFDETVKKNTPMIKSLAAYDELIRELAAKQGKEKSQYGSGPIDRSPAGMGKL